MVNYRFIYVYVIYQSIDLPTGKQVRKFAIRRSKLITSLTELTLFIMPEPVIKVKKLSKSYRLTGKSRSLKESISDLFKSKSSRHENTDSKEHFWVFKDLTFNVERGETLGILGKNGVGKSTLLKILSEITLPTSGTGEIEGKIASVLEIGMGFHPDLTGRENILLGASLLGMTSNEIRNKLPHIISFSGIEKFIDTPIKKYSSGMYVRLAFSLATHISADILLFDEVLSVGDAEFKLKTLRKIKQLSEKGTTIILVTHNMGEIISLCDRAMILEQGGITSIGDPSLLISQYVEDVFAHNIAETSSEGGQLNDDNTPVLNYKEWSENDLGPGNQFARINKICVLGREKADSKDIYMNEDIDIEVSYRLTHSDHIFDVGFTLYDNTGNNVFASTSLLTPSTSEQRPAGDYIAHCTIPANTLNSGTFTMNVFVIENGDKVFRSLPDIVMFKVSDNPDELNKPWKDRFPGPLRPLLDWKITSKKIQNNVVIH